MYVALDKSVCQMTKCKIEILYSVVSFVTRIKTLDPTRDQVKYLILTDLLGVNFKWVVFVNNDEESRFVGNEILQGIEMYVYSM